MSKLKPEYLNRRDRWWAHIRYTTRNEKWYIRCRAELILNGIVIALMIWGVWLR